MNSSTPACVRSAAGFLGLRRLNVHGEGRSSWAVSEMRGERRVLLGSDWRLTEGSERRAGHDDCAASPGG